MTLLEYIKLDEISKNNLVLEKGILLDVYTEDNKRYSFFSLFDFFVEIITCDNESRILESTPYESNFRFGMREKEKKEAHNNKVNLLNYYFLT